MQDVLGLPQAWPFSNYGFFASGGVSLGNLNLEFVEAQGTFVATKPAQITGLGFEPAIPIDDAYGKRLDERHVDHSSPMPGPSWTNMSFTGLGGDLQVFATDYHVDDKPKADLARRKPLDDVHGGRLGLTGAGELMIGVPDLKAASQRWEALFDPALPDTAVRWSLGSGPAVRLVQHNRDAVLGLALDVRNPDAAATLTALRESKDPLVGLPLTARHR